MKTVYKNELTYICIKNIAAKEEMAHGEKIHVLKRRLQKMRQIIYAKSERVYPKQNGSSVTCSSFDKYLIE